MQCAPYTQGECQETRPDEADGTTTIGVILESDEFLFRVGCVCSGGEKARKTPSDSGSDSEASLVPRAKRQLQDALLAISEVPEWLQENEYILTGYRAPSNSWVKSVRSILGIHNETINIWSHIVGCILFLTIPIYVFTTEIPPRYKVATTEDIIVCTTYFVGVAICFFLSSAYHTLANHSSSWHFFTVQLDYLGILILMYSAHIPLIYYGFVCDHGLRAIYWGITSFLALLCAYSTLRPGFADVQAKMWRAAFYTAFGASSFAPIIHAFVKYGWEVQNQRMGLTWWALVAVFNLVGVVTYGLKMPEKFFPGRFDIVGQSHQIMHISVVVAGMMHVMGCLGDFDYLHEHGAQCS